MTLSQLKDKPEAQVLSVSEDILIYFWHGVAHLLDVNNQNEYEIVDQNYWHAIGDVLFKSKPLISTKNEFKKVAHKNPKQFSRALFNDNYDVAQAPLPNKITIKDFSDH